MKRSFQLINGGTLILDDTAVARPEVQDTVRIETRLDGTATGIIFYPNQQDMRYRLSIVKEIK